MPEPTEPLTPAAPAPAAAPLPPHLQGPAAGRRVLERMLDRLFAALVNGPAVNCRPHRSRQRVDWFGLSALNDLAPAEALRELLGEGGKTTLRARVPATRPERVPADNGPAEDVLTDQPIDGPVAPSAERVVLDPADVATTLPRRVHVIDIPDADPGRRTDEQVALLQKLHIIVDDARTYEQDTGVHVLNVGFPLLSLPPAFAGVHASGRQSSRRTLAPLAFVPVSVSLRRGATWSVEVTCRGEGTDRVTPNAALIAWIQRQTGRKVIAELFADERGQDPWREVRGIVEQVCRLVDLPVPAAFAGGDAAAGGASFRTPPSGAAGGGGEGGVPDVADGPEDGVLKDTLPEGTSTAGARPVPPLELQPAPQSEEMEGGPEIVPAAVLGLFPMANQGLLRDMQDLVDDPAAVVGPLERFVRLGNLLDGVPSVAPTRPGGESAAPGAAAKPGESRDRNDAPIHRSFADERLVTESDPCQARAVRLARQSPALVIHGPPGTGKSQTIANIIGDHLARGQRVLFVCEKRTALDVVANRLEHMGLGSLVGVVHDPQRDQRDLYRQIREHLETLAELKTDHRAADKLRGVDDELQRLHAELTAYRHALTHLDAESGHSFHELMGQWLASSPPGVIGTDATDAPHLNGRVSVDRAAAAELGKVRLRDLAPLEHPLREMYLRAQKVAYARNPWSAAVGIGLQPLLGRPVEENKSAVEAVVSAAAVADETARDKLPALPPFLPALDLPVQAKARVQLVERVEAMLEVTPPDVLDRWAGRPLSEIRTARSRLTEAQPYLTAFNARKPDAELTPRWAAAVGENLPAVLDLTQQRDAVGRYGEAFGMSMQWVDQIRQKAPAARWPAVARWVATDTDAAAGVLKKLDAVGPLADRAAAAPLDPELLAPYRRQPFDIAQLLRWQSAVETYLPVAKSIFGFLQGGKKRAAAPALEFFGLGLSYDSAARARDFLAGLRARLEVWDAATAALPPEALHPATPQRLPDDAELFGLFDEHRAVLRAAADLHRPSIPAAAASADPTALVNHMVAAEHAAAEPVFRMLDLPPTQENAKRVHALYQTLIVRVVLQGLNENVLSAPTPDGLMDDHDLEVSLRGHAALFDLALAVAADEATRDLWPVVAEALADRTKLQPLLDALKLSPKRAADVLALERALADAGLFAADWMAKVDASLRAGDPFTDAAAGLRDRLDTLEDVVRVREAAGKLPPAVRPAAVALLDQSAAPAEAWDVLRRDVLAGEIRRRLAADPHLQDVDGHRLATTFDRYRELQDKKRDLVRAVVLDQWVDRQKDRLLSDSGTRLSSAGAELGRRLLLRGERAIRLRQVIARGRTIPGGDPLLDVCPVWMVSPETAAQVFPREPIFDVVVFDEASQCRLEEALPVLTRGKRVVIAGDPKQLPPTRFFETAFAASEDEDEPADDQGWFERQQGEVEDLLTAALGLEAQQSYLDVHYRSKHAALIGFSNEHFYGSRLQPIPGHPSRRPEVPPIRLVQVEGGVYDKRRNEPEADAVVALVRELLAERKPPSIGIACFNMVQRDLIVEKLDDLAAEDTKFAKKLAEARERVGAGSFEGLFVKNLENVQGDERDHLVVSTTYGPDRAGKFYRRFGPLAMPGGGRRLNVLVTRARQQVHLVTSIPAEAYRSLPEPGEGQTPGGGWLLFAYLRYAEELGRGYEDGVRSGAKPQAAAGAEVATETVAPAVRVRSSRAPSAFAESLAHKLSEARGARSDVYWGNDGFCVDLVLKGSTDGSPDEEGAAALGVLCDAARFAPADDLMEWDVFRTGVLEAQGWKLHRVWTPHFFRDPQGRTAALLKDAAGDKVEA